MRIRTIKPEFFKDEELAALHPLTRLFFIGLWSAADKNGIIEDRPARLAIEILPYDMMGKQLGSNWEVPSIEDMLHGLTQGGWILRYTVEDKDLIAIRNWDKHQRINGKEAQGEGRYPLPDKDLWQKKERGSKGEAPEKQSRSQEQGTGNREQGREQGNEYLVDSDEPTTQKKSKTQNEKFDEEFEPFWKQLLPVNRAGDGKKIARERFRACRKLHSLDDIFRGVKHWEETNLSRDPEYRKGLSAWLYPENLDQVLTGQAVKAIPKKSDLQKTYDRIDELYGVDSDSEESRQAAATAYKILSGGKS